MSAAARRRAVDADALDEDVEDDGEDEDVAELDEVDGVDEVLLGEDDAEALRGRRVGAAAAGGRAQLRPAR